MLGCGLAPHGYEQKRWVEGELEYYDDEWGNLWVRMQRRRAKGEILRPAIEDWSQLESFRVAGLHPPRLRRRDAALLRRAALTGSGSPTSAGWIFDNARYLRKMEVYFADMALYPEEVRRLHAMVAGGLRAEDPPRRQRRAPTASSSARTWARRRACSSARRCSASTSSRCTPASCPSPTSRA